MTLQRDTSFDLGEARERLSKLSGRAYWKSLEELSGSEEFEAYVARAYPEQAHKFMDPPSRREALKLLAASLALGGVTSCTRQPKETILPYATSPESSVPGKPLHYATAMPWATGAIGLLVESHMGRPTKVEGNPDHPASLGATDAFAQASVLSLYDPDRTQVIQHRGRIATWNGFLTELRQALASEEETQGAGLRVLTPTVTSPTLARQLRSLLERYPNARWHQWDAVNRDPARRAALATFGRDVHAQHHFEQADVIVSLDADFLGGGPESVLATQRFSQRRRDGQTERSRLYMVESCPSVTGSVADHRKALSPSGVRKLAHELLRAVQGETSDSLWLRALVRDLQAHRGTSLVVAGRHQPSDVHQIAHQINALLENGGRTVTYTEPTELNPTTQIDSLRELVEDMRAGQVKVLAMLGGNPSFDAPADLEFASALEQVGFRVHLGDSEDETSNGCDWHIPRTSYLETWSDARAADGTVSIVQPLIAPLYFSKSEHELVAALSGETTSSYDAVRATWQGERSDAEFERWWNRAVHDGLVPDTALPVLDLTVGGASIDEPPTSEGIEIVLRPDATVWDGRFANNGWLQELPKPLTKLTWDNAALIAPATAQRLKLESTDVVELTVHGRTLEVPVWVLPGHAENTITVHLGYGRTVCGELGRGTGVDAYPLRTSGALDSADGVAVRKLDRRYLLASTQDHDSMEGRDLVRSAPVQRFLADAHLFDHGGAHGGHETSIYPEHEYEGNSWGMVIDLGACTGCNACVVACQAENNIPVVGKDEVARGRELHWMRIDRYFGGDPEEPEVHHQPVLCMHCENAPCEVVCPVNATVHGGEGLNEMVYNRCVGTRYCSNNCPYKVRRFNFFPYADFETESLKLQRNPDVTVRSRGVMEKCTYCVQRINEARIEAKKEGRPIRDGEVKTACQQVCPAQAITFGNLNDETSRVAALKKNGLNYGLLEELNVKPRTSYLAKLTNPNEEMPDAPKPQGDGHGSEHGDGHGGGHG